ncbi:hypothetical protein EDB82DRAFT_483084 [Fusarium venenatum]|uniref:uncharacterized protein n=1 Tax=Fusarium venenatum TaxID=56646 RepID=UPI001DA4E5A3|nr:hypothetical protein EDB82DRAFT_483084 [Fusarium venenatum]
MTIELARTGSWSWLPLQVALGALDGCLTQSRLNGARVVSWEVVNCFGAGIPLQMILKARMVNCFTVGIHLGRRTSFLILSWTKQASSYWMVLHQCRRQNLRLDRRSFVTAICLASLRRNWSIKNWRHGC